MKHTFVRAAMAAGLLGLVPGAHAIPTLSLSADGGPAIACADGDACDTNSAAGVVGFNQSIGDFAINVTTAGSGGSMSLSISPTLSGMSPIFPSIQRQASAP